MFLLFFNIYFYLFILAVLGLSCSTWHAGSFFFFFFNLFMAVLGLRFCARAFSSCSKWGPLFIVVRGPLTIVASLVAEHRLDVQAQ